MKIPSPATIALQEQINQWKARALQPFPVAEARADEVSTKEPEDDHRFVSIEGANVAVDKTGRVVPGKEYEQKEGESNPPVADELGELNKRLIAAEHDLERLEDEYQTLLDRQNGEQEGEGVPVAIDKMIAAHQTMTAKQELVLDLCHQLQIANEQNKAIPVPNPADQVQEQQTAEQEQLAAQQDHDDQQHEQDQQHELEKEKLKIKAKPKTMARADAAHIMVDTTPILKTAAGVLFITEGGKVLLGLRAEPGEYCNHWGIFGGHAEPGETLEMTAIREVIEETGYVVSAGSSEDGVALPAPLQLIAQTVVDGTAFSYFVHLCAEPFDVLLNDEHYSYGWYAMGEEPGPMIPGLSVVLNSPAVKALRLKRMNERDIAQAMAWGCLPSPTKFANISMYRMRVTGTGKAFRHGDGKKFKDEHVYRPPEIYLNDEFVQRCNGLDVIYEHPAKRVLDSKEYADRKVGTVMLAYVADDEVWCVSKIYDTDTVTILDSQRMSTSPTVVFGEDVNSTIALSDGSTLLIEGKPKLLDHLAICEAGVWDKGGEPAGIESCLVGGT